MKKGSWNEKDIRLQGNTCRVTTEYRGTSLGKGMPTRHTSHSPRELVEFECCVTCTTSMTPKPVHGDRMSERSIKIEATSREHVQGWCGKGGDGQAGEWQWRNNTVNVAPPRCVHTTFPTTRPTLLSWYSQSFSTQLSYLMTYSISTQHGFTKVQSPLLVASGHCTQALSSYPTGQAPQLWLKHNKDNGCI